MKRWVAALCVVAALLLLHPLQDRIDAHTGASAVEPDLLYFTSPQAISRMALGYDSLLADLYWIRAIQYFGRRGEAEKRPVRYGNLATLLDIASTLDPDLIDIYHFGSTFLSEPEPLGAGRPDDAVRLLEKGISRHPEDWRLRHAAALVHFWYRKDFKRAADIWLEARQLPEAPNWLEGLAASALSRGGAVDTARAIWSRQLESTDRADVRENARNHLISIQVDEDLWTLEFLVDKFRQRVGRPPTGFEELTRAGWLRGPPLDPSGVPYSYEPQSGRPGLSPHSRVRRLKIPYDYRKAFVERLEGEFSAKP
jgi:tetratricopeptide (TPR) repeat protein